MCIGHIIVSLGIRGSPEVMNTFKRIVGVVGIILLSAFILSGMGPIGDRPYTEIYLVCLGLVVLLVIVCCLFKFFIDLLDG